MRLAMTELASGVDAFYLSGRARVPSALVEDLTVAREQSRLHRSPAMLSLGEDFAVQPGGFGRYPFRLEHRRGVIGLTTSEYLPAVRVQPRASFIHGVGIRAALDWFMQQVEAVLGPVLWGTSRVDLFMDSHGWPLGAEDRDRFVCWATQRVVYEDADMLTGLRFGSGKSGAVSARIYDKTEEIRAKGHDYWPAIWGPQYRPAERVLRVEFQAGSELLRQMGIRSPDEVLSGLPGLWGYLTDDWLTFRDRTSDNTRARWPVSLEWQAVQTAAFRENAVGLERTYAGETAGSLRQLLPFLRGYLSQAGALLGAKTLDETLERVKGVLEFDEARTGATFAARLRDKRTKLGLA